MRLPGFVAEQSLSMNAQHYRSGVALVKSGAAIHPAQSGCRPIRGQEAEDAYIDCYQRCRSAGYDHWGCRRGCCSTVTGSSCCYFV